MGEVDLHADLRHIDDAWEDPSSLTTQQLCLAWRQSYARLLQTSSGGTRERLVRMRRGVLDEMGRRDADGFARWLQDGARGQ